jgi:predicted nucleic acid-binding protein
MSRPQTFSSPLTRELLVERIHYFETPFHVAEEGPGVTRHFADLILSHDFGGRQVHDANIVAAMQAYAIARLLTFNVDDFKRFEDIIQVVEP